MNKFFITTTCVLIFASWNALALDEHHPDQAQTTKTPAPDTGKTVQKMQDNVKKMQGQLDRIAKTKDARERQKLLQEHMRTMQENMMVGKGMMGGMSGGMMDCPMMKDGMKDGMGMMGGTNGGAGMPPDAMMSRMQMMEKRMEMMQMMMEQMKSGQQAQQPVPITK